MRAQLRTLSLLLPLLAFAACGDEGGVVIEATSSSRAPVESTPGLVRTQILLTLREIHAHVVGGPDEPPPKGRHGLEWRTKHGKWMVATLEGSPTIDLLELPERPIRIGHLDLPEGKITQLRLFLDEEGPNEVVRPDGRSCPLHIPSSAQTGIKVIKPFKLEVEEDEEVRLAIDFKLRESIVEEEGCAYRLSPVFEVRVDG